MSVVEKRKSTSEISNEVLKHLADAWNTYQELPTVHKDDEHEFKHAIHSAQNIILARSKVGIV